MLNSEQIEQIFKSTGKVGRPPKYEFCSIDIDQVSIIDDEPEELARIQKYAHVYASQSGKKFTTRKAQGKLLIKRIA